MTGRLWLAWRALLALALLVGFYVLAITVGLTLLWLAYAQVVYVHIINPKLLLLTVAAGLIVLWAAIPRREAFVAPGPRIVDDDAPALFSLVADIAHATDQPIPEEVFVVGDVNAFVGQCGGLMGFGGKRIMGIGLPLLQVMTVQELKAILAHEFGHYVSRDVSLGPLIYRTRSAISRVIRQVSGGFLQKVFAAYGRLFVRVTHAVSRRQEFIADEVSAHIAGAPAAMSALRKAHATAPAFHTYWQQELAPVLGSGYLPPIAQGFAAFLAQERIAAGLELVIREAEASGRTDPFDTHPALKERLAALQTLPADDGGDQTPATTLVPNLAGWERRVLGASVNEDWAKGLQPVDWERIVDTVYLPMFRDRVAALAPLLAPFTVGTPPTKRLELARLGQQLRLSVEGIPSAEGRAALILQLVAQAIVVALTDRGWTARTSPGAEFVLLREGRVLHPATRLAAIASGSASPFDWRRECEIAGVGDVPLVGVAIR